MLGYYFSVTAGVKLERSKLSLDTSYTQIYDNDGALIVSGNARTAVPYEEMPAHLPLAFVAVEDKRFFTHNGLDYKRMAKAVWKNLTSFSFAQGASTISQQLIKNTHLTSEKTLTRKLKEIKLTRALEKNYSKEQIIELYLNSIYFGHNAFGIREACRFYFDEDVNALNPAQSATLAALVQSPNRFSPFKNPEKCLSRRNTVLKLMNEQGYLSAEEYRENIALALPVAPHCESENAYLDMVYEQADELLGVSGRQLRIETFYRKNLQAQMENMQADSDRIAVVRDNATGGVKAYFSTCGNIKRLPASTIKPLLVYAPALEENAVTPLTPLLDEKTDFNGYSPDDYATPTGNYMSVRYALSHSVNIPAVRVLNTLGVKRAAEYLERMNLHVDESDKTLALALGGMKDGFTLIELSDAYATFANGGLYSPSSFIKRITDETGRELYSFRPVKTRVFSEGVSFLINDMLQTTAREGTARKLKVLDFPVCAKTGTNEGKAGNLDAYTLSYTADDTVGVWLGNGDNSPVNATGGGLPANMALELYKCLYAHKSPSPFFTSDEVEPVLYDRYEYEHNQRILLCDPLSPPGESGKEYFKKSFLPKETCSRFSCPKIQKPNVYVRNSTVLIELCQAEYYDYEIKRENRGKTTTIYNGKYKKNIYDNSVIPGEVYRYTVTPVYKGRTGESIELPAVRIEKTAELPSDWWE